MKKYLIVTILAFFGLQAAASHVSSGSIYYDKLGGGSYKVYLLLTADNYFPVLSSWTIQSDHPSFQTISLQLESVNQIDFPCSDPTKQTVVLYSAVVNFGSLPAGGITLYYHDLCCRYGLINMDNPLSEGTFVPTTIVSTATNTGSPRMHKNTYHFGFTDSTFTLNTGIFDPDLGDSLHIELAPVLSDDSSTPVVYETGYSYNNPFGNSAPTTIDHQTGLITVSGITNSGQYQLALKVESYSGGLKESESYWDFPVIVGPASNGVPETETSVIQFTGLSASSSSGGRSFVMAEGDVLQLATSAQTISPDSIRLQAYGAQLANTDGTANNCNAGQSSCATHQLNPLWLQLPSTQTGVFTFSPDSLFVPAGRQEVTTYFFFEGITPNGNCMHQGQTAFVKVTVQDKSKLSIWSSSSVTTCSSSPVRVQVLGDTTNLQWSPAIGVSNTTSASPYLSPPTSTVYTVTNLNNGEQITVSCLIGAVPPPILVHQNNVLSIPNNKAFDEIQWYYNGAPVAHYGSQFIMQPAGHYFARVKRDICYAYSDTVYHNINQAIPLTQLGDGEPVVISTGLFYELDFELIQHDNILKGIEFITPNPDLLNWTTKPDYELLDMQGNSLISASFNGAKPFFDDLGISQPLSHGQTYTLKITVPSGPITLFKPHQFPYFEPNGVVKITDALYSHGSGINNDAFPYVNLLFESAIGIEEHAANVQVYPNPVMDVLVVDCPHESEFTLYSSIGQIMMKETVLGKSEIDVSALAKGVYVYTLEIGQSRYSGRIVKQ